MPLITRRSSGALHASHIRRQVRLDALRCSSLSPFQKRLRIVLPGLNELMGLQPNNICYTS